jgi:hypothetical protein
LFSTCWDGRGCFRDSNSFWQAKKIDDFLKRVEPAVPTLPGDLELPWFGFNLSLYLQDKRSPFSSGSFPRRAAAWRNLPETAI